MSIRVVCENGHELKVKASMAGKTGLCPQCRVVVHVPIPPESLEDSILDMLRKGGGNGRSSGNGDTASGHRIDTQQIHLKKACIRCNREVEYGTHICPHCHTYIASLADFRST